MQHNTLTVILDEGISPSEAGQIALSIEQLRGVNQVTESWPKLSEDAIVFMCKNNNDAEEAIRMCQAFANGRPGKWLALSHGYNVNTYTRNGFVGFTLDADGLLPDVNLANVRSIMKE